MFLNFDDYQKDAKTWLHEVQDSLGIQNEQQAGRIFRAVLHAIRDRLIAEEAVHFGAQLPLFWKGVYYEGFKIRREPPHIRHEDEWLDFIRSHDHFANQLDFPTPHHAKLAFRDVMRVLEQRISPGQFGHIIDSFPAEIQELTIVPLSAEAYW